LIRLIPILLLASLMSSQQTNPDYWTSWKYFAPVELHYSRIDGKNYTLDLSVLDDIATSDEVRLQIFSTTARAATTPWTIILRTIGTPTF
jgi:hypothetical protein